MLFGNEHRNELKYTGWRACNLNSANISNLSGHRKRIWMSILNLWFMAIAFRERSCFHFEHIGHRWKWKLIKIAWKDKLNWMKGISSLLIVTGWWFFWIKCSCKFILRIEIFRKSLQQAPCSVRFNPFHWMCQRKSSLECNSKWHVIGRNFVSISQILWNNKLEQSNWYICMSIDGRKMFVFVLGIDQKLTIIVQVLNLRWWISVIEKCDCVYGPFDFVENWRFFVDHFLAAHQTISARFSYFMMLQWTHFDRPMKFNTEFRPS